MRNEKIQLLDKNKTLVLVDIQEIVFVEEEHNQSKFITLKENYSHFFDYDKFSEMVVGHNFAKSNRGIFVNLERIKKYDQIDMWLYFEDCITDISIKANVGQNYISKFKKILGKTNSVDYYPELNMRSLISQT